MTAIKTLDFSNCGKPSFVNDVRDSLSSTGFFLLSNHDISEDLLEGTRNLFWAFFATLTEEQRTAYFFPGLAFQTGYAPLGSETGEHAKVPDHKRFFQFGDNNEMPKVKEVPGLKEAGEELYAQFNHLYRELMRVVAISLGLSPRYFKHSLGNSIMRFIHYPAHVIPTAKDEDVEVVRGGNAAGMCASKHTDINSLTLLHATQPGLQLLQEGSWEPVSCNADTLIINAGDMLWHLTGGLYKSGVHRVVCQPGVDRMAWPFFGHRRDEASIVPLKHLGPYDPKVFHFKTEGEFLRHRLEQIFGKKVVNP